MGFTVIFDEIGYREALKKNRCKVLGIFLPFIKIDRTSYDILRRKSSALEFENVKHRLSKKMFANLRGAVGFTLRYARTYFPAYRFFVNEYINDEWLATVDWHKKFHRDHVIHQPMSVYVGLSLLKGVNLSGNNDTPSILFNNKTLLEWSLDAIHHSSECKYLKNYLKEMGGSDIYFDNSPASKILWENLFLESFFLATLFHDMGYPWLFVNSINKKLVGHFPHEDLSIKDAEWITQHYGKRLLFYPLFGYKKPDPTIPPHKSDKINHLVDECLQNTHGISGAISLLYLNDALRIYPDIDHDYPERRFCIEWAAMAVMMHDMVNLYSKIDRSNKLLIKNSQLRLSINKDPLSFVLALTDQIQDFGRPDSSFCCSEDRDNESTATYSSKCMAVVLDMDDAKKLQIIYYYDDASIYLRNREEFLPKNEIQFFDPNEGYLDYQELGISKIELVAELQK